MAFAAALWILPKNCLDTQEMQDLLMSGIYGESRADRMR